MSSSPDNVSNYTVYAAACWSALHVGSLRFDYQQVTRHRRTHATVLSSQFTLMYIQTSIKGTPQMYIR